MHSILKSKTGTVILSIALVSFLFVTGRLLAQKYQTDNQIKQLQAHADQIRGENQELSDLLKYLNSEQYQEKAAREQLNLKKDGEVVVALPQQQEQIASARVTTQESNVKKWYEYFFRNQ
ncbi:MAG: septum formation initiator family protein [Candidatus Doudnabacteria bacterium]|nr:septum formation initiator family protein [Candidatus Doudnabacteria bacterium]